MIGLALDSGSSRAGRAFSPLQLELNGLLARSCPGAYADAVADCVLAFHVSGEVADFGFEGCGAIRLQKRPSRLAVEIGVPASRWEDRTSRQVRGCVATLAREAVGRSIAYLKEKGQPIPKADTVRRICEAIDRFEALDGAGL
jgi:hypothetical protein